MPKNLTGLRVFIASPGGLAEERKAVRDEIQEFNDADAVARGVLFQAVGWEDTLGGIGRPQTLINEDIRACDYFILFLWDRWGSPTGDAASKYSSGTEEEYHVAMECHASNEPMRQLVLMFKSVDPKQLSDPGSQLQKVLEFKKDIEQERRHLFHTFDSTDSCRRLIRRHLAAWLRGEESGSVAPRVLADTDSDSIRKVASTEVAIHAGSARAWELANEGRLTEAEVEFAKISVGQNRPEPLIEYGRFLRRVGRLEQAQIMFERAAAMVSEQHDDPTLASAYQNLGLIFQTRGDLATAERMHRQSLEINERLGRLEGMANAYGNLGMVRQTHGDLDGAEEMHRSALEINERLGQLEGMANAYGNLGIVLRTRGDSDGAEEMHRQSLRINEQLGRLEGIADDYKNLGVVLQTRGDLDGAEEMYRQSLRINERLGRLEGMANAYGNLGIVLQKRGDLDGAEGMYRESFEINERLGRLEGMANAYDNLGTVRQKRGDLHGAEEMHRQSLKINERLGRLEGMANVYANLGVVLQTRGDLAGATQMFQSALESAERLGSPSLIARNKSRLDRVRRTT